MLRASSKSTLSYQNKNRSWELFGDYYYVLQYKYLFIIGVLFIAGSCNKDHDSVSEDNRSEALFGQWECEGIDSNTDVDINRDSTVNVDLFNTNEIRQCLKDNLIFSALGDLEKKVLFLLMKMDCPVGKYPHFKMWRMIGTSS